MAGQEPEDGWVTSEPLVDTELVAVVLCRYTGALLIPDGGPCEARQKGRHPDEQCAAVFFQADAARRGLLGAVDAFFDAVPAEMRVPRFGDEPTGR